jgi:hypothetical protein
MKMKLCEYGPCPLKNSRYVTKNIGVKIHSEIAMKTNSVSNLLIEVPPKKI